MTTAIRPVGVRALFSQLPLILAVALLACSSGTYARENGKWIFDFFLGPCHVTQWQATTSEVTAVTGRSREHAGPRYYYWLRSQFRVALYGMGLLAMLFLARLLRVPLEEQTRYPFSKSDDTSFKRNKIALTATLAGAAAVLATALWIASRLSAADEPHAEAWAWNQQVAFIQGYALGPLALLLLYTLLLAPLVEELIFRATLLPTLQRFISFGPALLLQAVVFGLCHYGQGIGGMAWTTVTGIALGIFYRKTGRLAPVVLAHGFLNGVALVLAFGL